VSAASGPGCSIPEIDLWSFFLWAHALACGRDLREHFTLSIIEQAIVPIIIGVLAYLDGRTITCLLEDVLAPIAPARMWRKKTGISLLSGKTTAPE